MTTYIDVDGNGLYHDVDDDDDELDDSGFFIELDHYNSSDDENEHVERSETQGIYTPLRPDEDIELIFDDINAQTQGSLHSLDLATRKAEVEGLISKVRSKLDLEDKSERLLTLSEVIDAVFGKIGGHWSPWTMLFKNKLKAISKDCRKEGQPTHLLSWEVDAFIEATLLLHIYQISPEDLWNPVNRDWYKQPLMQKRRFSYIQSQLASNSSDNNSHHQQDWLPRNVNAIESELAFCWKHLGATLQELSVIKGVTVISLDDEKEHLRSIDVSSSEEAIPAQH